MNIIAIGRSSLLLNSIKTLNKNGFKTKLIITCKELDHYKVGLRDFQKFASDLNIQIIVSNSLNKHFNTVANMINKHDIKVAISVNYPSIIKANMINAFKIGIFNAHFGELPKYKGNATPNWVLLNGEKRSALCIHKMTEELDSGPIINKEYINININTKIGDLYNWMDKETPRLFLQSLKKLKKDKNYVLELQMNKFSSQVRCYPRNPEDSRIDWTKSNEEIIRLINASSDPFPGAYSTYNGQLVRIFDASLFEDGEKFYAVPGQICNRDSKSKSVCVITGNGKVKLNRIKINNKDVSPYSYLKSVRLRFK